MSEEVKVNDKAVERLKKWIILMENQNNKTRSKTDPEMVKAIKKRIEEEANAAAINYGPCAPLKALQLHWSSCSSDPSFCVQPAF